MAVAFALAPTGATSARGFMFSLGCIQSLELPHRPLPDRRRHAGPRARPRFGGGGQDAAGVELPPRHAALAGRDHGGGGARAPRDFRPEHFSRRVSEREVMSFAELYPPLPQRGAARDGRGRQVAAALGDGERGELCGCGVRATLQEPINKPHACDRGFRAVSDELQATSSGATGSPMNESASCRGSAPDLRSPSCSGGSATRVAWRQDIVRLGEKADGA